MKTPVLFVWLVCALCACTFSPDGRYAFTEHSRIFVSPEGDVYEVCEIRTFGPTGPMGSSAWHKCGATRFESFLGTTIVVNEGQFYQLVPPIPELAGVVNFDYLKEICPGIPRGFTPEQFSQITWEHVSTCSPTP